MSHNYLLLECWVIILIIVALVIWALQKKNIYNPPFWLKAVASLICSIVFFFLAGGESVLYIIPCLLLFLSIYYFWKFYIATKK